MAVVRKKQDDKILKTLRELVAIGGNKECFDCGQKGPTYINMTIGSFVCTTCSGILRGITPPHRVKSISMATFTQDEIDFVRQSGNDACSRTWLGLWDPKRAIKQEHRDFMIDKYERKRYYLEPASPLKSLPTNGNNSNTSSSSSSLSANNGTSSSSSNTNIRNGTENLVPLKTITLTPPASLRLSRTNSSSSNALNGTSSHTSSVNSSSTNLKFQQQFTPDDSNFFSDPPKILPPTPQKHSSNHHQRLNGTVNGNTFERNQKNGLLTSTNSSSSNNNNNNTSISGGMVNANKFTPDSDFVADFSNANIISVNGASNAGSGLKNNNNHKLSNGFNENGNLSKVHQNRGEMENFADFEHNTIYNAAGLPIQVSSRSTSALSTATPSVDRYAALKDLDDQFREIKFESEANNNNNNHLNGISNGNGDVHQTSTANPFKTVNPFQQSQQTTHNWNIPASTQPNGSTANGFYATSPYQNGFVHPHMLNGNVPNGAGFPNTFHHPSNNGYVTAVPATQSVSQFNGPSVNHFGHYGNPFVTAGATTTTSNSNNPFL